MRSTATILLLSLSYFATNTAAQRPLFYGLPTPLIISKCLEETGVTAKQVSQWEAQSINCRDIFGEIDEARHFHVCLITKQGYVDSHENVNLPLVYQSFPNMDPAYIQRVYELCDAAFVPTGKPFERAYYYNKCVLEQIGAYPWRSRTLTIVGDTNKEVQKECREEAGISEDELCVLMSNFKEDGLESDYNARCYHVCLVRKYNYYSGTVMNNQMLVDRYSYKSKEFYSKVYKKCIRPFTEENVCDKMLEMHKCFRFDYGEYPVDYSISPTNVQFIIPPESNSN